MQGRRLSGARSTKPGTNLLPSQKLWTLPGHSYVSCRRPRTWQRQISSRPVSPIFLPRRTFRRVQTNCFKKRRNHTAMLLHRGFIAKLLAARLKEGLNAGIICQP